jgi:tetratricopeptide (TPR) repeat protein
VTPPTAPAQADEKKDATQKAPKDLFQPLTQQERRTTSCSIYLHNLNATLSQHERNLSKDSKDPLRALTGLSSTLYALGRFSDDPALIQRAIDAATQGLALSPANPTLLLIRLRARASLHLFPDSLQDLQALQALPPKETASLDLPSLHDDLLLNTSLSPDPALLKRIQDKPITTPTFDAYTAAALLYAEAGDPLTAHRYLAQAERRYDDTTPIPLAWLNVQRGLLDLHTGNFSRARTFYLAALDRCPTYPLAIEHLAEVEGLLGNHEESIRLYNQVIELTDNPEFIAALSGLYADLQQPDKSLPLRERARARFLALVSQFPSAMSWHAADFFLSDPSSLSLALSLLTQNVALRPTPDAFHALAQAQLSCALLDDAQASIQKALSSYAQKPEYHWTAAQIAAALNLPDDAQRHQDLALKRNPLLPQLEGPPSPPPPPPTPCTLPSSSSSPSPSPSPLDQ